MPRPHQSPSVHLMRTCSGSDRLRCAPHLEPSRTCNAIFVNLSRIFILGGKHKSCETSQSTIQPSIPACQVLGASQGPEPSPKLKELQPQVVGNLVEKGKGEVAGPTHLVLRIVQHLVARAAAAKTFNLRSPKSNPRQLVKEPLRFQAGAAPMLVSSQARLRSRLLQAPSCQSASALQCRVSQHLLLEKRQKRGQSIRSLRARRSQTIRTLRQRSQSQFSTTKLSRHRSISWPKKISTSSSSSSSANEKTLSKSTSTLMRLTKKSAS